MLESLGRLQSIVGEQFRINPSKIKPETNFTKELGADSLDVVEFVILIENEFDIEIEDQVAS